ncbi:hypothetical protein [Sphingobium xenophagum]|uniref:hypothetical protein n=1 Tax=Sphingobium xenophagum TaxID=121428 RepID=UPI0021CE61B8|nr:hypothetical protein [Sphingobium xenophagum]
MLEPATIERLVEFRPFTGGSRCRLEVGEEPRRRGGPQIARDVKGSQAGFAVDHDEGAQTQRERGIAGDVDRQQLCLHHRQHFAKALAHRRTGVADDAGILPFVAGIIITLVALIVALAALLTGNRRDIKLVMDMRSTVGSQHDIGERRRFLFSVKHRPAFRRLINIGLVRIDAQHRCAFQSAPGDCNCWMRPGVQSRCNGIETPKQMRATPTARRRPASGHKMCFNILQQSTNFRILHGNRIPLGSSARFASSLLREARSLQSSARPNVMYPGTMGWVRKRQAYRQL